MNRPSPRLAILRAQLAAEASELQAYRKAMAGPTWVSAAPAPDADSLPLPPSYWDDLEHWTKTLAPAKPATPQPEPAAEVWHDGPPPVAGVYAAESTPPVCSFGSFFYHFDGRRWAGMSSSAKDARSLKAKDHTTPANCIAWSRLIEADAPAEKPVEQATHSVCIKAHHNLAGAMNRVGDVIEYGPASRHVPECWLPCDKDGWVSHTPTADSVCPVPAGVKFATRLQDGEIGQEGDTHPIWSSGPSPGRRIIAWRPTGSAE